MTQDNSQAKTKAPAKSARRRARELALQGLYQWLLNRNDPGVVEAHLQDARRALDAGITHEMTGSRAPAAYAAACSTVGASPASVVRRMSRTSSAG